MLDNTQSSPFGWWESINAPVISAWEGIHPGGGAGACPHMWGQSFATSALLDALVAEKSDGSVLVGRGIPNNWVSTGQVIELTNYPLNDNKRMGFRIEALPGTQVLLTLTGDLPAGKVIFALPVFINNIQSATGGSADSASGEVTLEHGTRSVTVSLASVP